MTTKKCKMIILILICILFSKTTVNNNFSILENQNFKKNTEIAYMAEFYEELTEPEYETKTGSLTGYAANCSSCSGKLGCNGMDVRDGTTTYQDKEFGKVSIVASSKKLKCGSIVRFTLNKEEITAIVLDRGVLNNDLDLLVESESYANKKIGRKKITYDILRNGY